MTGLLDSAAGLFSGTPQAPQDPFEEQLRKRTLTALGLGLLAKSGPSRTPTSFGQAFGQAGMGAMGVADQARSQQMNTQLQQAKLDALRNPQQKPADFERRIAAIMSVNPDMSRQDATNMVLASEVVTDPFTGTTFMVDKTTRQRIPLSRPGQPMPGQQDGTQAGSGATDGPPTQGAGGNSLFDDLPHVVGMIPNVMSFISRTGGQFIDALSFPEIASAENRIGNLKARGRKAFTSSNRPSKWELQQVDELFPDTQSLFRNPDAEAAKLATLVDIMKDERKFLQTQLQRQDLSKEARKESQTTILELDKMLDMIGTPKAISSGDAFQQNLQMLQQTMGVARDEANRVRGVEAPRVRRYNPETGRLE